MNDQKPKDSAHPSGPVNTNGLKVKVDRDLCIGAATCVAVASRAFGLDSEAKAIILDSADKEITETIIEAAKSCPTMAIIIEDERGQRIFPK